MTSQNSRNKMDALTDDDQKAIIDSTSDDITESDFFSQNNVVEEAPATYKPLPEIVIDANGGVSFNGLEHSENEDEVMGHDDSNNILSKSLTSNKHAAGMARNQSSSKSSELIDRLRNLKPKSNKNRAKSSSLSTNTSVKEETYT